jgi:hypothetical protein
MPMNAWFAKYQELVQNPEWLESCCRLTSVGDFLQSVKSLWQAPSLSDDNLIGILNQCNRQCLAIESTHLASHWLPYSYNVKTREIQWCLPDGLATEPFHDEFITRCRQHTINQLIRPTTSLAQLLRKSEAFPQGEPGGFIFHLSRCGSTLLSGALSELADASVLSESSLLTSILLDGSLSSAEKGSALRVLVNLQAQRAGSQLVSVVKWNAWDIFSWPLLRELYPTVPVVFLIRNPAEILASHERCAGRHMSGDRSLKSQSLVLVNAFTSGDLAGARVEVLRALMAEMLTVTHSAGVPVFDYEQLNADTVIATAARFGLAVTNNSQARIRQRLGFHSKNLEQPFQHDSTLKQQALGKDYRTKINPQLMSLYRQLRAHSGPLIAQAAGSEKICAV